MSILIMLNNLIHDFSVAVLFSTLLIMTFLYKKFAEKENLKLFKELYIWLKTTQFAAWIFIIIGGIVRTLTYEQFEWVEAAGKGQVAALIFKHVILIALVISGLVMQFRLKNKLKLVNEK